MRGTVAFWWSFRGSSPVAIATLLCIYSIALRAELIPVKQKQGAMHGFLVIKSADGKVIALGDQVNTVKGDQVRSRLVFHFRDGSVDDDTTVFTQDTKFHLISDHHIQRGPCFPAPTDVAVEVATGKVTWREANHGKTEVKTDHMDIPRDLANGLASLSVENFPSSAAEMKLPYLAGSSKPRIVQLLVTRDGQDTYQLGGVARRSIRFNVHIEIGGLTGVIAPLVGKEPSDLKIWASDGDAPVFLKIQGAMYLKGPIWRTELVSPVWSER